MANNQNQNENQRSGSSSVKSSGASSGHGENRGFAPMDDNKQREIAAEGGRAAHRSGNAHEFDSDEAREAGRKGGQASSGNRESGNQSGSGSSGSSNLPDDDSRGGDVSGQGGRARPKDDSEE